MTIRWMILFALVSGRGQAARAAVVAGLLAHTSEMYGISTVYLRARNVTPPASER